MFLFSMLLFFVVVCAGAWLLLFPAGRALVAQSVAGLSGRAEQNLRSRAARVVQQAGTLGRSARDGGAAGARLLRRRWPLLLAAAVLVTVPPLLALVLSSPTMLGGYEDHRVTNEQVAQLLKGERLAAPAALPPPVFTTAEVTLVRPMLDSANRNWQLLDADFSRRLLVVFRIMKEQHGYDMAILEGYRSPERQNALAAAGPAVTNARAFQSYHQFGLAADCAFVRDGKLVISEKDPWAMRGYRLYGEVAQSVGLTWGGRWKMMDFGHTEMRVAGTLAK